MPYPHRALRTEDYLYIRNFAPDRTPMGDAGNLDTPMKELETVTFTSYACRTRGSLVSTSIVSPVSGSINLARPMSGS